MSTKEDPRYKAWRDGAKSYNTKIDNSSSSYYANLGNESNNTSSEGYAFLAIGLVIFLIVGGLLSFADIWLLDRYNDSQDSKDWPTVIGTIEESYIKGTTDSEGNTTYYLVIVYNYSIEGADYNNSAIGMWGASSEWGHGDPWAIDEYLEKFPEGGEAQIYYNPDDYQDSVLEPGVSGILYFLLFLVNLIIVVLFFGSIIAPIYYIRNGGI